MTTGQHTTTVPAQLRLTRIKTVGCYAEDDQGRGWATFETVNDAAVCALCGATITRGWWRALSEEYVCSGHVEWMLGCKDR